MKKQTITQNLSLTVRGGGGVDFNSQFLRMEVPSSVAADGTFLVKITFKNTGSKTWGFWPYGDPPLHPAELFTISPRSPDIWGTDFIIQGQGTFIESGQEFTHQSMLRAPSAPGRYPFHWRLTIQGEFFGETTPYQMIEVTPRLTPIFEWPSPAPADPDGKRPILPSDLDYLGSIRLPHYLGNSGSGFSDTAISLKTQSDGSQRLLANFTFATQNLWEAPIPEPVKYTGSNVAAIPTLQPSHIWGAIDNGDTAPDGSKMTPNAGIFWDDESRILFWSWYHGYWTGGSLKVLHATRLNEDGSKSKVGSWEVSDQKWHWGGIIKLPPSFSNRYLSGLRYALGFGGYFNICGPCSRGAALSAISTPDPSLSKIEEVLKMLGTVQEKPALRQGDYLNANCGYWGEQAYGKEVGYWTFDDYCRAGILIDLPDKQGYLAFTDLGTGRLGYDYASITHAGTAQDTYFYDTRQLGEAAQGLRPHDDIVPYAIHRDSMKGTCTGAAFDETERLLYVLRKQVYQEGWEWYPLLHVYRIK